MCGVGIDLIELFLVVCVVFLEIFVYGCDLIVMMNDLDMVIGGKVDKVVVNVKLFMEVVYDWFK